MIDAIEALIKQNQDATDENNTLLEALVVQTQKNDNKDELEAIAKASIDIDDSVKESSKNIVDSIKENTEAIKDLKPKEIKGIEVTSLIAALSSLLKGEKGDSIEGKPGKDGEDGKTPKKGIDYFTDKEVESIIKSVLKEIPTPKNGITPVKGVDYFDGKDGLDGKDAIIDYDKIIKLVVKKLPKIEKQKTSDELLEDIKGKISYDDLNNLPDLFRIAARDYDFLELKDAPKSYKGQAGKFTKVNATEDGLEFGFGDGTGDMHSSVYDPEGGNRQVAFSDEVWKLGGNTLGSKKTIGSIDNQDFGIITNNSESVTVLKNGNVGIGTTNPGVKLDVVGQGKFQSTSFPVVDIIRDTQSASGSVYGAAKLERLMTGGTASNGTGVGFYFKNPDNAGNSTFSGIFGSSLSNVVNGSEVGDVIISGAWQGVDPYKNQHLIVRATGPTTGNVLVPNGNVGIGTTTPVSALSVIGDIDFSSKIYLNSTHTRSISYGWDATAAGNNLTLYSNGTLQFNNNGTIQSNSNGTLTFNTGTGNLLMTVGNVGIGITTPTAKLDINSDILRLRTAKTPATAGASGNAGDICWDSDYLYVWVNTNTVKRVSLSSW